MPAEPRRPIVPLVFAGMLVCSLAPALAGPRGLLDGHAPMMVRLGAGELRLRDGGALHRFHVARGFLQVVDNEVSVLAVEVGQVEGEEVPTTGAAH